MENKGRERGGEREREGGDLNITQNEEGRAKGSNW